MARVVAICQARLGSTRLPKKVLASLGNECVIQRLLRNLQMVPELDAVALAVPEGDGELLDYVPKDQYGTACPYPEDDVLSRYGYVAAWLEADVIVRITGDCPLIDPVLVSDAIRRYKGQGYFWVQGYPKGVGDIELFSRDALEKANAEETDARRREHVWESVMLQGKARTPWCPDEYRRPNYRVCIDEQADLDAVRALLKVLGHPATVSVGAVVSVLDARPDIVAMNAHVVQRSL